MADLLPITRTLSVMLTHKCNAACTHCGTLSSPRVGGRADLSRVLAAIDQAAGLGFGNVVFTGGEPTIYFEDLLAGIAHAKAQGLLTRVVTNAVWCRSPERAASKLDRLREAGLDEINFSAGDEHQRFVPLDHVVTGIVLALDRRMPVHLMVEKVRVRSLTRAEILASPRILAWPPSASARAPGCRSIRRSGWATTPGPARTGATSTGSGAATASSRPTSCTPRAR